MAIPVVRNTRFKQLQSKYSEPEQTVPTREFLTNEYTEGSSKLGLDSQGSPHAQ
jgi:hypothetical protein